MSALISAVTGNMFHAKSHYVFASNSIQILALVISRLLRIRFFANITASPEP